MKVCLVSVKLHTPMRVKDAVVGKNPVARDRVIYAIERRAIVGADFLTTLSEASVELTREILRAPQLRAAIVRNPIDVDEWKPAARSRRSRSLLFVGRFETYKGPDRLPPVLNRGSQSFPRRLCATRRRRLGFPRLTDAVRRALDPEVRPRVVFWGRLSRADLVGEYQSAGMV
jgi:glycosyltransferase involved in cell wall biosynthesis